MSLREKIEAAQPQVLPGSQLAEACVYTLSLWDKLKRFPDPELELSNNLAENSMRPIALGRRNGIHISSLQAGPKIAAILSVVESCRRLKIPVREFWLPFFQGWLINAFSNCPNSLLRAGPPCRSSKRRASLILLDSATFSAQERESYSEVAMLHGSRKGRTKFLRSTRVRPYLIPWCGTKDPM